MPTVETRLGDLDAEIAQYKMDLSPIYVQLLFNHSNYANMHQASMVWGAALHCLALLPAL